MEVKRQRKILIGVLGLGLGALTVDRLVLAPPNTANAAGPNATPAASAPDVVVDPRPDDEAASALNADAGASAVLPRYAGLARRLTVLTRDDQTPEAVAALFAEPTRWAPAKPKPDAEPSAGPIESPDVFRATYKLSSVTETRQGNETVTKAVINGKSYRVGDTLETFVLRGFIDNRSAGRSALWESLRTGQMVDMQVGKEF